MTNSTLQNLLQLAIAGAEAASKEILEVYHSTDFEVEHKEDDSPLTLADRNAHQAIVGILNQSNLPILSEEGRKVSYNERKDWERFWLVDPLDGTKEFVKRNGEFTVNIALVEGQEPILGVVALPVKDKLYYAVKGAGAFEKKVGGDSALAKRPAVDLSQSGLKVVASRSHMNAETEAYVQKLDNPQLISAGSSLKFIAVATGEADVYPRYVPTMEWDTAAADIIVREVGLSTISVETQEPLLYNKENLLNPYFVCG